MEKLNFFLLHEQDDPNGRSYRESLLKCRFGWIKFVKNKNVKWPGFLCPPDSDGISWALKVTTSGSVSKTKKECFEYNENIPENEKEKAQAALRKLNKNFNFSFV